MYTKVIISMAFLAFASAADVLQVPSVRTINLRPEGSIIDGATRGLYVAGGLSPIISSLYGPALRTANIYSAGALLNNDVALNVFDSKLTPITTGLQGPSTRTVNVGPDGSTIDSVAVGGVVSKDGSVLVGPSQHDFYGRAVNQVLLHTAVPSLIPETRSLLYTSGYYPDYVQVPYGKSIVAGPSGTIVAK